ncbi:exodeoxyribonuclease V subunit gamma [Piscinibacter sakaiensis]|uniref:exodeoxyribonuclease V subunit gamma n=1 Tax=Piscinibacter sakaiensis TaxID=1547922 RepID=UPI003AAA67F7
MNSTTNIRPGLLVLHGNRAELLGDAVFEWIGANPLGPLEEEIFLVQSNGVAEWLKMNLAGQAGICAATRVELPARFLWRAYRQVLGRDAVPAQSPLDKLPLTWRLMHCLPQLVGEPGYEPLAGFLQRGGIDRRLQLAQRLADLYDQYQVYRSDWLGAWAAGDDVLPAAGPGTAAQALPAGQRWQAGLWRELLAPLTDAERTAVRPQLQQRFLQALESGAAPASPLPRRVVLFGMTHVPMQTLQALDALADHSQVILAIPNPCRFHWADIIQGRELLRFDRRRHPLRGGRDLAELGLDEMFAHSHPLLAAWGRQGRDFIRQLDVFDDALATRERFALNRIDLFSEGPGDTLLEQVQANIRDLLPLAEHRRPPVDSGDRSIVFHIAHSAQREVEILHDQLLQLLAARDDDKPALNPRDIVVMVPDIETFAPAIRSVFGQYPRGDARFIPFDIADLQQRGNNPLLLALEWLLQLPQQRCRQSELRDLLDVPAVRRRFGVGDDDVPTLAAWMQGSGFRWGLDRQQREALGLGACGEQNSLLFGLRRMLLGYASGEAAAFDGIAPYPEVGGLEAAVAGSVADLVTALLGWADSSAGDATPADWAVQLRRLVGEMFEPSDDRERLSIAAFDDALRGWLDACDAAGFAEPVPLAVAREACLAAIDEPGVGRRFRAGGVTFCTLLPMRSIPFDVVCLLGMNDGDYPRSSSRSDFDLMALPGQGRPGDRSRREDDRQLMLEAVLSARRVLYVSWTGRSVRDNSEQPPSVLVSQLRDYLDAGWHEGLAAGLSTEHPLQPFSRRYFVDAPPADGGQPALFTFAREWRAAHLAGDHLAAAAAPEQQVPQAAAGPDAETALTIARLARFLRNPVRDFFRNRLAVVFAEADELAPDDESFRLAGLQHHQLLDATLKQVLDRLSAAGAEVSAAPPGEAELAQWLEAPIEQLRLSGDLPMAELGRREAQTMRETLLPMLSSWVGQRARLPHELPKQLLQFETDGIVIADWLTGVRVAAAGDVFEQGCWIELTPTRLLEKANKGSGAGQLRSDKLLRAWVTSLLASAAGSPVGGIVVGRDATLTINAIDGDAAAQTLTTLLQVWRDGMAEPLPLPIKTALATLAEKGRPADVYDGSYQRQGEVHDDPCLARMFGDFETLSADGRFAELAERVFRPLLDWAGNSVRVEVHAAVGADEVAE